MVHPHSSIVTWYTLTLALSMVHPHSSIVTWYTLSLALSHGTPLLTVIHWRHPVFTLHRQYRIPGYFGGH